eukprot:1413875-Prorocentrum_lima.AAC.1
MEIRKQNLTTLSSCEARLVGMIAGTRHAINLIVSLGESTPVTPCARVLHDNATTLDMARAGPSAAFRT